MRRIDRAFSRHRCASTVFSNARDVDGSFGRVAPRARSIDPSTRADDAFSISLSLAPPPRETCRRKCHSHCLYIRVPPLSPTKPYTIQHTTIPLSNYFLPVPVPRAVSIHPRARAGRVRTLTREKVRARDRDRSRRRRTSRTVVSSSSSRRARRSDGWTTRRALMTNAMTTRDGWIGRPPIDRRAEVVRRSRARRDGRDATRRDVT